VAAMLLSCDGRRRVRPWWRGRNKVEAAVLATLMMQQIIIPDENDDAGGPRNFTEMPFSRGARCIQ